MKPFSDPLASGAFNLLTKARAFTMNQHQGKTMINQAPSQYLWGEKVKNMSQRESHERESKGARGSIALLLQVAIDFPYLKSTLQGVPF